MSQFMSGHDKSFKAGADLNTTTSDWRAVYINSSQSVNIVNTTTVATNTVGILQNRPKSGTGAACHVRLLAPSSKVFLNDTCSAGDIIIVGSTGAIRGTSLTQTANFTEIGKALESSGASGTIIEVMLGNPRKMVASSAATTTVISE